MKTYKLFILSILSISLFFWGCNDDDDVQEEEASLRMVFNHHWDGIPVTSSDFNDFKFTTEAGDLLSIERLRYLISDVQFITDNNELTEIDIFNFIDVTSGQGLTFISPVNFPEGSYRIRFTFGLDNEDNAKNYPALNSASFSVPAMLGGGYHYMQFDGKFINTSSEEQGFNYHAIRAVDISGGSPVFPQDTFFQVDLGIVNLSNTTTVEVEVNLAEWFKNPNTWQLNELNSVLMPNADAQILMYENGATVFDTGAIIN